MGMGYGEVDRIAKAVPNQLGIKLDEALVLSPQLKEMHDSDTAGRAADRVRPPARGRRAQRVDARRGRRHQPRAADRADAAPAGDQLRRADDPVRDARHRGARPAQVRLPRPVQPHDPAQGGRPHPRATAAVEVDLDDHPARRQDDVRAARLGRDDRACSSSSPRACAATSASSSRRRSTTSRPWSRSTARGRWTTSRPTSAASTARRR